MSGREEDGLRAIRRRLFELVRWFGESPDRLSEAQRHWPGAQDQLWAGRVTREVDRWLAQLDAADTEPIALTPPDGSPPATLLELEAVDHAAWLWAGSTQGAPPDLFGAGHHARAVVRLGRERRPHTAGQSDILYTHVRYHALVPTQITIPARPSAVHVRLQTTVAGFDGAIARASVGLATTSFDDMAVLEWDRDHRATGLRDGDLRASQLSRAIQQATNEGLDVLVAPELTITPTARDTVARELRWRTGRGDARLALIVPGTFHEQVGTRFVNRAVLLDGLGNTLFDHHKLASFGTLDGFHERIDLGDSVTLLVTPIGTVAIAICKDFCDDHLSAIWHQLQPEWLLVPAFGRGESAHRAAAERIHRMLGTVTVLAHQRETEARPFRSFIHRAVPLTHEHAAAPAIVGCKILL